MSEVETVEGWAGELKVLGSRIGQRYERSEPREQAIAYLKGLMSDVQRKNGWQLAEQDGETRNPFGRGEEAVQRHSGSGRELSNWGFSRVCE